MKKSEYEKKLDFNSDTFASIKEDLNEVLQNLLKNMLEKGSSEGSMTLKINVSFEEDEYYDPDGENSGIINIPVFEHKVTSSVQIKSKTSGVLNTQMRLVFDEKAEEFVMAPIANAQQRSIFDDDFKDENAEV